ncbi:histidinol dehydrogenase [Thorsellia anophelis]|uniref:Histidinol dehydrogenase n=1 Tax=Thorsellia anophelis DSM 18579 TaxID=1123402 RepID=A0A1I0EWG2_9GAMM|nr:histidinol dehydrogenase [Thorsellia anophelis]SET49803.1 histidinol dehydrogenase [Thorsellia anophelis DSM 18579]
MPATFQFNAPIKWADADEKTKQALLQRPAMAANISVSQAVEAIINQVKDGGDAALKALSLKFDKTTINSLLVDSSIIEAAANTLSTELKTAIQQAKLNISTFHEAQLPKSICVETMPGVICEQVTRPIEAVGLYIPGGSAPLFSTVLMLAAPAKIAGCKRLVLCSPPPIAAEILYAAKLCGVDEIYQVGGAQAIAAMAFGTESIPKVDKIFGPGNSFVTEAKRQVSQAVDGASIDMPAGPSEVLVIGDERANPAFIAADLLSQAEHGPDSQVILLTESETLAHKVIEEVTRQLALLPRQNIASEALTHSRIIITRSIDESIDISNQYGPEHLILQIHNAEHHVEQIMHAGSVFVGDYSPESAGDYASGTNHVLPTYGYTKTYSSLGLADFQKRMTVQKLSKEGLKLLGPIIEVMAEAELLQAHKQAVSIRLADLNK